MPCNAVCQSASVAGKCAHKAFRPCGPSTAAAGQPKSATGGLKDFLENHDALFNTLKYYLTSTMRVQTAPALPPRQVNIVDAILMVHDVVQQMLVQFKEECKHSDSDSDVAPPSSPDAMPPRTADSPVPAPSGMFN